ncbi:hypothetical protein GCM10011519_02470 [Marmoricola endophyticus]|uniref:Uncharacterized protein n=1 Tax=Marmoricola endophyticus TaxID=2040280 RepID=A0A917B9H4_9ACTN|nr:hypothetical protein GCM10011519_02470 [Marmoricola endophyticus]
MTAERLVDAVVDDLPQAVGQTAGVGRADVHARALADGLEPLEYEEVLGVVGVVDDSLLVFPVRSRAAPNLPSRTDRTGAGLAGRGAAPSTAEGA